MDSLVEIEVPVSTQVDMGVESEADPCQSDFLSHQ